MCPRIHLLQDDTKPLKRVLPAARSVAFPNSGLFNIDPNTDFDIFFLQQKSRCDPGDGSADTGFSCRRCRHFNLHCSLSSPSTPNNQDPGPSTNIRTPVLIDITPARRSQRPPPVPVSSTPPKPYSPPPGLATPKFEHPVTSYDTPSPRFAVESIRPPLAKTAPLDKHAKADVGGMWGKALTLVNDLVTPGDSDTRPAPDDIIARGIISSDEARELTRMCCVSFLILK